MSGIFRAEDSKGTFRMRELCARHDDMACGELEPSERTDDSFVRLVVNAGGPREHIAKSW